MLSAWLLKLMSNCFQLRIRRLFISKVSFSKKISSKSHSVSCPLRVIAPIRATCSIINIIFDKDRQWEKLGIEMVSSILSFSIIKLFHFILKRIILPALITIKVSELAFLNT